MRALVFLMSGAMASCSAWFSLVIVIMVRMPFSSVAARHSLTMRTLFMQ
jgi:hypothetical protein